MDRERLLLVLTIVISSIIFTLCLSFILCLWQIKYLILRDPIVQKIKAYPTELTLISTVISTILSVTTTALFTLAVKHALSHYITQPLSLFELHTAIALTKPQPLIRWNHRKLSLITVFVVGLITLLNSSWTTLILPTHLTWPVPIQGRDLDLGSPAFDAQLGNDMNNMGESSRNFSYILDVITPMSGISASHTVVAGGNASVFAFNGVSYSKSSSGIVPAVEEYAGTSLTAKDVGLKYYGGKVVVDTTPLDSGRSGLSRTYSVAQQGLSANITCSALDPNDPEYSINIENDALSNGIMFSIMTVKCPLGNGSNSWPTMKFQQGDDTDGLLGITICPDPGMVNATSFDILLQGQAGYSSVGKTVCKVAPYVASFDVTYSNGNISIDQPYYIQLLQNTSVNVTTFISNVLWELSDSSQTTWSNPLGQLVQLINGINPTRSVYDVLENYFRGVVEFSGTYLRSAYSAEGAATAMPALYSDQSAFKPLNGTILVLTYGWSSGHLTYIYILGVLTVIWAITVAAAAYSLIQRRTQLHPLFDAANPVHLMMASSAGGLENLAGFNPDDATRCEDVRVRLEDDCGDLGEGASGGSRMRFKIESVLD